MKRLIVWLCRPWIVREARRCAAVMDAIWEVRWDKHGLQPWEITTDHLYMKLGERYSFGLLYRTIGLLERGGHLRWNKRERKVAMTSKGVASMLEQEPKA